MLSRTKGTTQIDVTIRPRGDTLTPLALPTVSLSSGPPGWAR